MQLLNVRRMGEAVQGVRLYGDPENPEPLHFRVCFPGGDFDLVRCENGSYWAHLRINHESQRERHELAGEKVGRITDARVDHIGKHASETTPPTVALLNDPAAYHFAARVEVVK